MSEEALSRAKLRADALHTVGCDVEDILDEAVRFLEQYRGGQKALGPAAKNLNQFIVQADREMEQGTLSLSEADVVKRYVRMCAGSIRSMREQSRIQVLRQEGKVESLKETTAAVKKQFKAQEGRINQLREAITSETSQNLPGQHPGPTLKEQRLQEDDEELNDQDGGIEEEEIHDVRY